MVSSESFLHIPDHLRRGDLRQDEQASVDSGERLINLMCDRLGLQDLAESTVLDMGCGVKFTQAILANEIPIKKYVGVDVYLEMVNFLRENVNDPRFEFHHMDTHNAMYNRDGEKLAEHTHLPLAEKQFDLICLFSVMTHLVPEDYRNMLKILRPYVKDEGQLFYSVFLDEQTDGGHGLVDQLQEELGNYQSLTTGTGFCDVLKEQPLKWALYSREYAKQLVEDTGWEVVSIDVPTPDIQHHLTCRPIN